MKSDGKHVFTAIFVGLGLTVTSLAASSCRTPTDADPEPTGGGQKFVLDRATFDSTVAPILSAQGCDNVACHGGGIRGTFEFVTRRRQESRSRFCAGQPAGHRIDS